MDLQHIVELLEKESSKSQDEINQMIQDKKKELSGLISDVGAAHIVANELGVKLFSVAGDQERKVKDLMEGMSNVNIIGKITRMFEPRDFQKDDRKGAVGNIILEDETGAIRVTFWNELCRHFNTMNLGDVLRIKGGYIRKNNMMDRNELHLNTRSTITINPEGVSVQDGAARTPIKDVQQEGNKVELFGTIVNVFSPSYFEVCPQCSKRIRPEEEVYNCPDHGVVEPHFSYVINFILDDGTGTMRVACFRQQAEQLIANIGELRGKDDQIEQQKVDLLGSMIVVQARSVRNKMNNAIEVIANNINKDIDPDEELKKVQ